MISSGRLDSFHPFQIVITFPIHHSVQSIMHLAAANAIHQQKKQVAHHVAQRNPTRNSIVAKLYNITMYLNLLPSRKHSDTLQAFNLAGSLQQTLLQR